MKDRPRTHRRRSIRLQGYDYTQAGAYFITICTQDRACLFGDIVDGEMRLNPFGHIVLEEWQRTALVRPHVTLDAFVIMPNHIHGIIVINDDANPVGATRRVAPTTMTPEIVRAGPASGSVGAIVGQFKSAATKRINALRGAPRAPVWQRNYYEHIIRDDESLNRIRQYIGQNPLRWDLDRENLAATARQQEEAWER